MTTLSRVTGKVFGGSAPLDEIGQFGSAKAGTLLNTQDVATIQALPAYANGWGSAIMTSRNFPPIEEVTGVLKTISYQNCYLLQEGVPVYDVNTNYSATSIVKSINGVNLSFYVSLQDDNQGNSLSDTDYWAKASFADRTIGEIVTSAIPLTDAGLHLLDGSLLSGSGIYADFVSYIASIYNSSLNYFCTEAQWQASVTQYGVCGKFVYDSVNNTVRLPKVTGFIEGASGAANLGNLNEAGLPDITGKLKADFRNTITGLRGECSGAFGIEGGANAEWQGAGGSSYISNGANFNFDASRSSSIYGNSTTVQPQSIKVLYYIVVATTTKTAIEVDIDEIATDLNGKADVDLSNCTKPYVIDTYVNGTSWWRLWSDKWCEQGGSATEYTTINLLKPYANTNYVIVGTPLFVDSSGMGYANKTNSSFQLQYGISSDNPGLLWMTCGYVS